MMEFKVGDRVQVVSNDSAFYGDKGNVIENDGTDNLPINVRFDDYDHVGWFYEDDLKVLHEEETTMKFKVGDRVKIIGDWSDNIGMIGEIDELREHMFYVTIDEDHFGMYNDYDLQPVKEEETSMKFKVGDKVKVSNSWFEHDGKVGVIERIDHMEPYNYSVKFDVEGDNERYDEPFREDSLELVTQSFTKSDLKTGMGVVLRDGSKGHVLLGTEAGDVIRFINEDGQQWGSVNEYDKYMIDCDMSIMDIVEVYSSKYAYCYLTDRVFNQDCVFKREEPKPEPTKMTMKEINEHFGKAIEIIE